MEEDYSPSTDMAPAFFVTAAGNYFLRAYDPSDISKQIAVVSLKSQKPAICY
jgi:hypothetical protein